MLGGGRLSPVFGRGGGWPSPQTIGTIKEFNDASFDSTNFQVSGAGITLNTTDITLVGAGTTNRYVYDKVYFTDLEKWKYTWRFTAVDKTGTSYGPVFGLLSEVTISQRGYYVQFVQDTSTPGRLDLYFNSTYLGSSATNISWNAGDYIEISLERNENTITASGFNSLTPGTIVSKSYAFDIYVLPQVTQDAPNCGSSVIYTYGGTQIIDYYKMESLANKNIKTLFAGDSRYQGFSSNTFAERMSNLLGGSNTSGGSERVRDLIVRQPEIELINPQYLVLSILRNDLALGTFDALTKSDYEAFVSWAEGLGITVYHDYPPDEDTGLSGIDVSSIWTYLNATFPTKTILVPPTWNTATDLTADGVHWNAAGNAKKAAYITSNYSFLVT